MKDELLKVLDYVYNNKLESFDVYECSDYTKVLYNDLIRLFMIHIKLPDYINTTHFLLSKNSVRYQPYPIVTNFFELDKSEEEFFQYSTIENLYDLEYEHLTVLKKINDIINTQFIR